MVLSGSQWFSMVLNGSQWLPVVTNGSQWLLVVLNGSQWLAVVLNGSPCPQSNLLVHTGFAVPTLPGICVLKFCVFLFFLLLE